MLKRVLLLKKRLYLNEGCSLNTLKNMFNTVPKHIAIVMDGNGRWASGQGKARLFGHGQGAKAIKTVCKACIEEGIEYLSLFGFSTENWNRPDYEVKGLLKLMQNTLKNSLKEMIAEGIRLEFLGDVAAFPKPLYTLMLEARDTSSHCKKLHLNLALNYGSRAEVLEGLKRYCKALEAGSENLDSLNWDRFSSYLYTAGMPEVDLFIRPSGECRMSNFLLLQSAYAEVYFTPTYWPDFDGPRLREALAWYTTRERRYGKTSAQILAEPSSKV